MAAVLRRGILPYFRWSTDAYVRLYRKEIRLLQGVTMAFLEIKGVSKSFGDLCVLRNVNLTVNKGEVISIIGSSGSGKTTLLRCLNLLESVDRGEFFLDDEIMFSGNASKLSEEERRKKQLKTGLVFQSFNLFPHYTVLGNVCLTPETLIRESLSKKAKKKGNTELYRSVRDFYFGADEPTNESYRENITKKAKELLTMVGLESKLQSYPHQLSGGQQQRVAIARALALNPALLCFDEPTSALDPELTGEVLRVIRSLKNKDRTMIIVTHEMTFAKNVSDKVVFMADGVIEEIGTPTEIFENPRSEKLKHFISTITNKDGDGNDY